MGNETLRNEMIRKINKLEERLDRIQESVQNQEVVDSELQGEINSLRKEFELLKTDILEQLNTFTFNLWKLIFILLGIILSLIGIKNIPELLSLF